ncbi:MAG: MotA/TolQ/ExbB proton channel family protein [Planctomycetaceae bacterium]|nr:MotA/TolQ/ExbB proton channel family protein [Planctomycetaceae bacterium]
MSYLLAIVFLFAQADPLGEGPAPPGTGAAPAAVPGEVPADGTAQPAGAEPAADGAANAADAEKSETASDAEQAEEDAAADEADDAALAWKRLDEILSSGAIGLLREGGWFMWPILLMGVLAAGVIIERYRSLKMLTTDSTEVRTQVQTLLQEDRIEEALDYCDREQGPVPAILSTGVRRFLILRRLNYDSGRIEEQVVKSMDDYSVHIVAALEKHLPILATISSAAPMLGFLGTVSGMITSFKDIVAQMGETNIVESAAAGISEALLTTCFGLIVGIPAFVAFNYFSSVINRFVLEVEESATELIESVTLQLALSDQSSTSRNGESAASRATAAAEQPVSTQA